MMTSHATFSITRGATPPPVEPRWASLGFGFLVFLLLAFELARTAPAEWLLNPTLALLLVAQVTAPLLGLFIAPQTLWQRIYSLTLAILN
ncbi:MAG: hypothetical protein MI924_34620, partial [Chloroflexales bacterium]|nr:hypothetical protein [Chloroflexales bacterium]